MANTEKALVTTDAMQDFINTFKSKVYDWTNPSNGGGDKEDSTNKVFGLVQVLDQDIDKLFTDNPIDLSFDISIVDSASTVSMMSFSSSSVDSASTVSMMGSSSSSSSSVDSASTVGMMSSSSSSVDSASTVGMMSSSSSGENVFSFLSNEL